MMDKKLTLSIDERVVDFARQYAIATHQSISSIFEIFLKDLKSKHDYDLKLPDKTQRLYGSLEKMVLSDKKELRKKFNEKSVN